jgi:cytochrome bd-type quinol oxidase subunit 1
VVAFVTALLLTVVLVAIAMLYGSRRPVGQAITWGQAPHLFLTWADNELKWRPDNLVYKYWGILGFLKPQTAGGWFPVTLTMQAVRDLIVVGIYVLFLGFNMYVWSWWNNRQKRSDEKAKELETSDYGRPLVRKA